MKLILIIAQENYFDDNPKKLLLEKVQAVISEGDKDSELPNFDTTYRAGGSDHQPLFICELNFMYKGKMITSISDKFGDKKSAHRNAARKALEIIKQM